MKRKKQTPNQRRQPTALIAALVQRDTHEERKMIHAGFWRRFAAYWIDAFPIFLVTGLVFYFFLGFDETVRTYLNGPRDTESRSMFLAERNHIRDISFTLWLIYGVLMDASRLQGTLGKRLMGVRVVDEAGGRLSFARALARNSGKILSALPLFLGFMWIGWSKTKQGWHDKMSHCFIVRTAKDNGVQHGDTPNPHSPSAQGAGGR